MTDLGAEHVVTEDDKKLHADYVAEIRKRQISNAEQYDKAVLTFASAGLGFSIGFLKDFVPIKTADHPWLLYGSWVFFVLAVGATIASFLISDQALEKQKDLAEKYYWHGDEEAFNRFNPWRLATQCANVASGASLFIAMASTAFFVYFNLSRNMPVSQGHQDDPTERVEHLHEGMSVPSLQRRPPAANQAEKAKPPTPSPLPADQPVEKQPKT